MATPIRIDIDAATVTAAVNRLLQLTGPGGLVPAQREIGEALVDSTRQRFATSTAPDGSRWAPNTQTTYLQYLKGRSGTLGKDGRLNKRGAGYAISKKPLIGKSQSLSTQIYYSIESGALVVGSPMVYAAMQHFGGRKAQHKHLWGDIPARPFLGLSADDERDILDILTRHLGAATP